MGGLAVVLMIITLAHSAINKPTQPPSGVKGYYHGTIKNSALRKRTSLLLPFKRFRIKQENGWKNSNNIRKPYTLDIIQGEKMTDYTRLKKITGFQSIMLVRCKWCNPGAGVIIGMKDGGAQPDGSITDGICQECKERELKEMEDTIKRGKSLSDPVWIITLKQSKVLAFLISKNPKISKRSEVSQATQVPETTVRGCIRRLTEFGFITKPSLYRQGAAAGFQYTINEQLCNRFINERGEENIISSLLRIGGDET